MLVLILNEYTKPSDKNIQHLQTLFNDPYFIVKVCKTDPPSDNIDLDTYYYQKGLNYWLNSEYKNENCLIIKDNNLCLLNTKQITKLIKSLKDADLYYLSVYSDQCDKYITYSTNDNGIMTVWTKKPTSTQSIIFTPKTRDYILTNLAPTTNIKLLINDLLQKNKLTAQAFIPNIINFDIELATNNDDYIKINQCSPITNSVNNDTTTTMILWIIIVILLVLFLAWSVFQLGPRHK